MCFLWFRIAHLDPSEKSYPDGLSKYGQFFDQINIWIFNITKGLKRGDVQKIHKMKKLSKNLLEIRFYQVENERKHKVIPIEISKNNSYRVVYLMIYKNHSILKVLHVFSGIWQVYDKVTCVFGWIWFQIFM